MSDCLAVSPSIEADTPVTSQPVSEGFSRFGLRPELLSALEALGYETPSPIQKGAIPELLLGRDL
ncbi:MAG: ATP-dependent helicase, partial [Cyanobacteriota bacterium]